MAQIAAEVRRGNAKYPRQVKTENFILRFGPPSSVRSSDLPPEKRMEKSKQFWSALAGKEGN